MKLKSIQNLKQGKSLVENQKVKSNFLFKKLGGAAPYELRSPTHICIMSASECETEIKLTIIKAFVEKKIDKKSRIC